MPAMNQAPNEMLDLYWLAYLLTGNRDASFQAAVDAAELRKDASPFFSEWVLRWSRKIAIAKSLAAIREDLHTCARKTEGAPFNGDVRVPRGWSLISHTNKLQLEQALLAMDVFPRCALVLSIFEGLPLEDVATLLDEDRELVKTARAIGLQQLTRRLSASPLSGKFPLPVLPGLQHV
jgi:DNA-directed RNA polymerase specialized sigma24 family protein